MFRGDRSNQRLEPRQEFSVFQTQQARFLAASDAAVEADNPGSGGFHLIFFQPDGSQTRLSFVATNCAELQALWRQPTSPNWNFDMVLYAPVECPHLFRNRQGFWFLDNVAAPKSYPPSNSSSALGVKCIG